MKPYIFKPPSKEIESNQSNSHTKHRLGAIYEKLVREWAACNALAQFHDLLRA